jgi:hypothetical protein
VEYLKLAPDIDSDPDIEEAGWVGARVYELLLKVSALKDLRGRIPPGLQHPGWLVRRWNLRADDLPGVIPAQMVERGVARLIDVGLLTVEDGVWVIVGWEKFYRPRETSTARVRKHRETLKHDETHETDVTPETHTSLHSTHSTPPKETYVRAPDPVSAMGAVTVPSVVAGATPDRRGQDSQLRHVPAVPEKPVRPDDTWDAATWIAWMQAKRFEEGLPPDTKFDERAVANAFSAALMAGFTPKDLRMAFVAFGNDPYWLEKRLPIRGFISQLTEKYLRKQAAHAS